MGVTTAELARQRDRYREQVAKKRKRKDHLRDVLHTISVDIEHRVKRIRRLGRRIHKRNQAEGIELSEKGAKFIAHFEGVRLTSYNDPAGHCTIGIGHLISMAPCSGGRTITQAQAYELLRDDAEVAEKAVDSLITVKLDQAQKDALISFTFNLGSGALADSTLRKVLNAGEYGKVPGEMMRWVMAGGVKLPGLVARREAEGRLFANGDYNV